MVVLTGGIALLRSVYCPCTAMFVVEPRDRLGEHDRLLLLIGGLAMVLLTDNIGLSIAAKLGAQAHRDYLGRQLPPRLKLGFTRYRDQFFGSLSRTEVLASKS